MSKWIRRALVALLAITVLLAAIAAWLLRGSLPVLGGQRTLPALAAPVSIQRDALGVVTIEAASQADALRALGYVHAQERYFEMDLMRRNAAGELAALFGPAALPVDRAQRIHRMRARSDAGLDALPHAHRAHLQAYVDGVNAGLRALRVRPWPYLLLRQAPQPWQASDSMLAGHAMYFDLQDAGNRHELAMLRIRRAVPDPLYRLLAHAGSSWDAPLDGSVVGDAVLPDATALDLRRTGGTGAPTPPPPPPEAPPGTTPGSNNFAVSGSLTADGRAILADDMHLGLRAPNIWFRARLRYPDRRARTGQVDVSGFTLPGLPAVIAGSNGHIAWGFTNAYADTADWARLPTGAPVATRHERIDVHGATAQTLEVRESAWGPLVHDNPDGSTLALRWVAHLSGALNLGLMEFAHAGDLDQALLLAEHTAMPAQNLLLADRHGRIAWRILGALPARAPGCDDPAARATAACPPWPATSAAHPARIDPADGRLWTANARVIGGPDLARLGDGGYDLGARAAQIRDGLQATARVDEAALLAIQLDDRALLLERWWQLLRTTVEGHDDPALQRLEAASRRWDGRAATDSASYRMARAFRGAVLDQVREGLLAPARQALGADFVEPRLAQFEGVLWPLVTRRPAHLLPHGHADWDAMLADAARTVERELSTQGPVLEQRTWGERNTAAICHPLARAVPVARRWLCMPADPLPGDDHMPRVQGPAFGASQRMVVAPGHEADGIVHMPGGQSGHPLSPFWGAGHDDWVQGRPTPFLPGPARHTLRLVPDQASPAR